MAEVLIRFEDTVEGEDGATYLARVCGRQSEDGLWEGWVEFDPVGGGGALRSPRETKQPKRTDLVYWATGLTRAYLTGALERALYAARPEVPRPSVPTVTEYDGPAQPVPRAAASRGASATAVLDPFAVYAQGEDVLENELSALDEGHLRNIIRAHALAADPANAHALGRGALVSLIVAAVRRRAG